MKETKNLPNQESTPAPNTGAMLSSYFKEKRIRKSALARWINREPNTLYSFEKKASIQTSILWEICHALHYNFFADLAAQLPTSYATQSASSELANKIAQLEQEIIMLNREKNLLLEALKK